MSDIIKPESQSIANLREIAREIGESSKSEKTKRDYQSDWRQFQKWATSESLECFPSTPEIVGLYVTHMHALKRRPSTISRAMTSIGQKHKLAGEDNPVDDRVREMLKGVRRLAGTRPNQKKPITLEILSRCIETSPSDFLGIRNRAILLVGWTAALRRSEISALTVEDLEDCEQGIVVTIRKSKTDQEGKGRKIGLPFVDARQDLCAPRAVQRWLRLSRVATGPIFRRVGKAGKGRLWTSIHSKAINGKQISVVVKSFIARAGYNPAEYGGHSLRAGLATTLAGAGIEERRIQKITGHQSVVVLREYIREGTIFREHPVLELFD